MTWPGSPLLGRIAGPVWTFTAWSVIVTALCQLIPVVPSLTLSMHGLVGTALGLLLVFRTNTANDRYWEARKMWENVVANSRDISSMCCAFHWQVGVQRLRRICRLLSAFTVTLTDYVVGPVRNAHQKHHLPLRRLLSKDDRAVITGSCTPPSRAIQMLLNEIIAIELTDDDSFTSRERGMLIGMVMKLHTTVSQSERLVQTPIPQSYVRHTSRFLSLWILTLPLGLCHIIQWWTPLVVWMSSWALCGIQELGQVIEHPFDGPQSLRLSVMCNTVHSAVTDALQMVALDNSTQLTQRIVKLERLTEDDIEAMLDERDTGDEVLGRTPLHYAAYVGDVHIVALLIAARADANAADTWDGATPLDVARARNQVQTAQYLLDKGASSALFGKSKAPVPWGRKKKQVPRWSWKVPRLWRQK